MEEKKYKIKDYLNATWYFVFAGSLHNLNYNQCLIISRHGSLPEPKKLDKKGDLEEKFAELSASQ